MKWLVFSYSLPAKASSSPRVTLWRRLRRLGAISPTGGIHVLPSQDACIEGLQWLSREIQQSKGQAVVMHVDHFEGLTDQQLLDLFREARKQDYEGIKGQAADLEKAVTKEKDVAKLAALQDDLTKLQRLYADIRQIDYFDSPNGKQVATKLAKIAETLAPPIAQIPEIELVAIDAYKDKQWVTRPKPHVDRLACAWLIRRFINPEATIRYALQPEPQEVAFDMNEPGFSHSGNVCTFETMIRAFDLKGPGLSLLSEIVHEIDLREERYFHPEITGVDAILQGWLQLDLADAEIEKHGIALFEGLIATLSARS